MLKGCIRLFCFVVSIENGDETNWEFSPQSVSFLAASSSPFGSVRAEASCVALVCVWALGEQGRLLQGQGVSHRRGCLRAKEFTVPGNYLLAVQDGDYKFNEKIIGSCCLYAFCYYHILSYSLGSVFITVYGCIPV
jgi:hypothetical protein